MSPCSRALPGSPVLPEFMEKLPAKYQLEALNVGLGLGCLGAVPQTWKFPLPLTLPESHQHMGTVLPGSSVSRLHMAFSSFLAGPSHCLLYTSDAADEHRDV